MLARAKPENALTEVDRRHLQRADRIDEETCELLHPVGPPRPELEKQGSAASGDAERLANLTRILTAADIEAALVDLTRQDFAIPVVKAIAPQLQVLPSSLSTKRLQDTIARTGGAEWWTGGVPIT